MLAILPELPFTTYGDADLDPNGPRSDATSTPRRYPITDLETLTPWTSFCIDIQEAIQSATTRSRLPGTSFDISCFQGQTIVSSEEEIRGHAMSALHAPVQCVLAKLGVQGRFTTPGGGNSAVVGDPDFSWVMSFVQPHPKVVVRRSLP
jgi:hypothetical protein